MSEHSVIDDVVELLGTAEFEAAAASSPSVRDTLQGLLDQVDGEIAKLTPLIALAAEFDYDRLVATVKRRRDIAVRLRHILASKHCDSK